ncbi:MAG: hypothetical protein OXJ90_14880, partial [Spirochaetaceae bacterium]|nr:hypothetical protein [Spirochaetaceae bacterium]
HLGGFLSTRHLSIAYLGSIVMLTYPTKLGVLTLTLLALLTGIAAAHDEILPQNSTAIRNTLENRYQFGPDRWPDDVRLAPAFFDPNYPFIHQESLDMWLNEREWRIPSESKIKSILDAICELDPRPQTATIASPHAVAFETSVTVTYNITDELCY